MGCSKTPSVENEEDIDEYDERYDFYKFRSKRIVKNPIPPSKNYSDNNNNNSENNSNIKEENNKNKEEDENKEENTITNKESQSKSNKNTGDLYRNNATKKKKKNNNSNVKNNKNNKISDDYNKEDDNKNNKNHNGDIYDASNDNETNDHKNKNNKNNIINDRYNEKNKNKMYKNYNINEDISNNMNIYSNKNIFSEKGKTIHDYEKNIEQEKKREKEKEEKRKNLKRSKINGITIVENLKDYFPEDITKEEIQNLVFEAFGDSIVDDISLYIPGQTVTYEQAIELSNYIYSIIKNKKIKNEKCLENLNVKIDLVPLNKKLIKDKMFKGKDPSDRELENVYQSYGGESNEIKVLTIEFQ